MTQILYDPQNKKSSSGTTRSQNRFMAGIASRSSGNRFSNKIYNNAAEDNGNFDEFADSPTVQTFESIFSPLEDTGLLAISDGKAMIRTNTNLETFFAGLILIGVFTLISINKTPDMNEDTRITFTIIGIVSIVLGIFLKKAFASYSVFDNKQHKIYNEFFFFSKSFRKSKAISKNEILEVAVDHRKLEASAINMQNANNNDNREKFESAVVFLLKNGKLAYFNSFQNWDGANEFNMHLAISMSSVWGLTFKKSGFSNKFTVKKIRGKPTLFPVDLNETNPTDILNSVLRITVGFVVIVGLIFLMFWLVDKLA